MKAFLTLSVIALGCAVILLANANLIATRQRAVMLSEIQAISTSVEKAESTASAHADALAQASENDEALDKRDKLIALTLDKMAQIIAENREAIRKLKRDRDEWL